MTSPYLEQPLFPLGVALPQMLESIEAETETTSSNPRREAAFANVPN
jgi:hypothetical protein